MRQSWRVPFVNITLVAAVAIACRSGATSSAPAPAAPTTVPEAAVAAPPNAPSDANIAAIFLAANYTDISYAKLVTPARTQTVAIQQFAKRMLTDHTAVNQLANELFTTIDLTPEDNFTSLDFRDESAAKRDLMRELSGRAFDTTYIANEVSYHTRLLDALDKTLIPTARNAQLKRLLSNIRPAVAAHLAHAQDVRAGLGIGF